MARKIATIKGEYLVDLIHCGISLCGMGIERDKVENIFNFNLEGVSAEEVLLVLNMRDTWNSFTKSFDYFCIYGLKSVKDSLCKNLHRVESNDEYMDYLSTKGLDEKKVYYDFHYMFMNCMSCNSSFGGLELFSYIYKNNLFGKYSLCVALLVVNKVLANYKKGILIIPRERMGELLKLDDSKEIVSFLEDCIVKYVQ